MRREGCSSLNEIVASWIPYFIAVAPLFVARYLIILRESSTLINDVPGCLGQGCLPRSCPKLMGMVWQSRGGTETPLPIFVLTRKKVTDWLLYRSVSRFGSMSPRHPID